MPTPKSTHAPLPPQSTPKSSNAGIKRDFSSIANSSSSPPPARKRLRYAEIPVFARSARPGKSIKYAGGPYSPAPVKQSPSPLPPAAAPPPAPPASTVNGQLPLNGAPPPMPLQQPPSTSPPWEACITNTVPYEDLTRLLCDLIFLHIGGAEPPEGGAKFEIEAKLGEIQSREEHTRLRYPMMTEALVNTDNVHHKALNDFLNECLKHSQAPNRVPIHYKHIHESDAFHELTKDGIENLPPAIRNYVNPRHRPRVRITTDMETNEITAKIIKSRLVDFDIFSPRTQFDYRISISVESPWNGSEDWLIPVNEAEGRRGERQKDRVSYRHLAYQIDLTQVTYPATNRKDHELEVEVAPDTLRQEIAAAKAREPSRYEELVRGFVDNVRLLARQFPIRN
ncbi:MAG: hypothetical protein Q9160_006161 [Pyrenula sp. 1 TL-2023]